MLNKTSKMKDTHKIFINYKGYIVGCAFDKTKTSNNLSIEIGTEEEKKEFISILMYLKNALERLEF